jgi:arsenite methyltransferase
MSRRVSSARDQSAGAKASFCRLAAPKTKVLGPLEPASFDVIVSNCVINLSIDKPAVFSGAFALLKPGGELYFSDVYCDRRLPESVRADPELYGECLGGALYWNDFLPMAKRTGFLDPRLVTSRPIDVAMRR